MLRRRYERMDDPLIPITTPLSVAHQREFYGIGHTLMHDGTNFAQEIAKVMVLESNGEPEGPARRKVSYKGLGKTAVALTVAGVIGGGTGVAIMQHGHAAPTLGAIRTEAYQNAHVLYNTSTCAAELRFDKARADTAPDRGSVADAALNPSDAVYNRAIQLATDFNVPCTTLGVPDIASFKMPDGMAITMVGRAADATAIDQLPMLDAGADLADSCDPNIAAQNNNLARLFPAVKPAWQELQALQAHGECAEVK